MSQSSSNSWTRWSNTNKSVICGDATGFMAMGKNPQRVSPLRKAALRKDTLPDHCLAKQHAWGSRPAAGTHDRVTKTRETSPISSAAPRTAAWVTRDAVSAHALSGHSSAYTWFVSQQCYCQLGNDNCLSPTYSMLKVLSAETWPVSAEEIQLL